MRILIILLFLAVNVQAQGVLKKSYQIPSEGNPFSGFLYGNGIVDLLANEQIIWAGTGYGLNKSTDGGLTWDNYGTAQYVGKGGVAAIASMGDSILWISTAFDTVALDEEMAAGGGISYTRDEGQTWTYIRQPVDDRDEDRYSPTTTNVSNITYDIAVLDSAVWITSWAGGLRKSTDMGKTWQVVTVDGKPFRAANDNLIHLAFSVVNASGTLWVGTADGIAKSTDKGSTWKIFNHNNQEFPISGNFVVAMGWQEYNQTLWAATIEANDSSEFRAVSKSSNGGATWQTVLEGNFAHNFAFDGPRAYVACDQGLFVSDDDGTNWYSLPEIKDFQSGDEILTNTYYSTASQKRGAINRLWAGSADGLAYTDDNGNNWNVIRSYVRLQNRPDPAVYAYPSPFSPSRHGFSRFEYGEHPAASVDIKIYDFAMDHVRTIPHDGFKLKWDGTNESGDTVASGVYYFRADVTGSVTWGKIVVIN